MAADEFEDPAFGLGDRLAKARQHCKIKSAEDMAVRLNAKLAGRIARPIAASTISAWEAGTNQPTRTIRVEELIPVWIEVCNEAGAPHGRGVSAEFMWGLRTGSFSSLLLALDSPIGQGTLLDTDLEPFDFYSRADLTPV